MAFASLNPAPSETLFVTGLPMDCTNEFATEIFGQYGTVKTVTVLPVSPGKTTAAAFVIMTNLEDAQWIVDHVNGNVPQNLTSPVAVVYATPKDKGAGKGMMKGMSMMKGAMASAMSPMSMGAPMGGMGGKDSFKGGYGKGVPQEVKKYKTIMCRFFEANGSCQRGDACSYAHGAWELNSAGSGAAMAAAMSAMGKGTFTPGAKGGSGGKGMMGMSNGTSTMNGLGADSLGADSLGASSLGASSLGASSLGASSLGASSFGADSLGANPLGASSFGAGSFGAGSLGGGSFGKGKGGSTLDPATRFKTVMCTFFLAGTCTRGEACTFAHGAHELQQRK
ncbi:RBMS2 [Symbiodinium natans]|uniref:RBMS2 protein n=1 Tax=Symbiodinium natans TaxID=878477 RepID=A0A812Q262_9DINO|nr:RBMS2 [Symbiodinium natans]